MKNTIKLFAIIIFLYACKGNNKTSLAKSDKPITKVEYTVDPIYNNYAQRVAATDTSSFNDIDQASLVAYHNEQEGKINQIIKTRLNLISQWNKDIMNRNKVSDSSFVFYPFSGADFIHAYYLYPNASEYFMSAIENIGEIIDVTKLNKVQFFEYVKDFDTVMRDIYMRSYFITKNMEDDLVKKLKLMGCSRYYFGLLQKPTTI